MLVYRPGCYYCLLLFLGLKFWKVGSRKIYAVKERSLKLAKRKCPADSSSESDCSIKLPKAKNPRYDLEKDIREIKTKISSLFVIEKYLKMPTSLRLLLLENFKCCICQDTMKPPILFSRCCKYIIGCESCIDKWYTKERTCPRCRAERGFTETSRLNGIDDFLEAIKNYMCHLSNYRAPLRLTNQLSFVQLNLKKLPRELHIYIMKKIF